MQHLIPLIIAIIIGGFMSVLDTVLFGSQFSERSDDIKAQQFAAAGSGIESAMRLYETERATSAFDTDFATTMLDGTNTDGLVDLDYLTQIPVAPQGTYEFVVGGTSGDLYLEAAGTDVSLEVCKEVVQLDDGPLAAGWTPSVDTTELDVDMAGSRLHCLENSVTPGEYSLYYRVN